MDDFEQEIERVTRALDIMQGLTTQETHALLVHMGFTQAEVETHYPNYFGTSHEAEAKMLAKPTSDGEWDKFAKNHKRSIDMTREERRTNLKKLAESCGLPEDFFTNPKSINPLRIKMDDAMMNLATQIVRTEEETLIDLPRDKYFEAMKLRFDCNGERDANRSRN